MLVVSLFFLGWSMIHYQRKQADVNYRRTRASQVAIVRLVDDVEDFTKGDLTIHAKTDDDTTGTLAESINFAVNGMRLLVEEIKTASVDVNDCSQNMESLLFQLLNDTDQQYREIGLAVEELRKISTVAGFVSDNVAKSSEHVRISGEVAQKGVNTIRKTVQGMGTTRTQVQDTLNRLRRLSENSQQITQIVNSIEDVAERTNVLALNASIQAAMAGEAGRGFAVVVEEVQRLAEKSSDASAGITELVKSIQQDINNAIFLMETTAKEVTSGVRLVDETGAALSELKTTNQQLLGEIVDLSTKSENELEGMDSINSRMETLIVSSSRNRDKASEVSVAMNQIKNIAQRLNRSIVGFKLN